MSKINSVYLDTAEAIRKNPDAVLELRRTIDPVAWVQWVGLLTEKGDAVEFVDHKPLKAIYRDLHPNQSHQKGAQIGMTETIINKLLWYGDTNRVTVIYTMPNATLVEKFSKSRFNPVIKSNQYLARRMKGSVDNAGLKHIGDSWIHFSGAQKESQAISVPADILVHDEWDFSDIDVLDTYGKRTIASKYNWQWRFSTPTLLGYGINAEYAETDQRVWVVRCERCNRWQEVDFWINTIKRRGAYYFGCYKCGKRLKRRDGIWMAKEPEKATDAIYKGGKLIVEAGGTRGYFINPLAFTFVSAEEKMRNWKRADKSNKPIQKKNFFNFELGLPYVSGESMISEETILRPMQPSYETTGFSVMGVDQGDVLHYVVKHIGSDGRMPVVKFGTVTEWSEIDKVFYDWGCSIGVTDALPNKEPARKLVQRMSGRFWMAYYKDQNPDLLERTEGKVKENDMLFSRSHKETRAIHIDRTETLDVSAKAWIDGRSYLVGFRDKRTPEMDEFISQMQGMKRDLEENAKGNVVARWVRVKPDHYRHADNYATVASMLRKPRGRIEDLTIGGESISSPAMPLGMGASMIVTPEVVMTADSNFRDWT